MNGFIANGFFFLTWLHNKIIVAVSTAKRRLLEADLVAQLLDWDAQRNYTLLALGRNPMCQIVTNPREGLVYAIITLL